MAAAGEFGNESPGYGATLLVRLSKISTLVKILVWSSSMVLV